MQNVIKNLNLFEIPIHSVERNRELNEVRLSVVFFITFLVFLM